MEKIINHKYTEDIVCPYCGDEIGDSWEYPEEDTIECGGCYKEFKYHRDIDITYVSRKL